MLQPGLEIVDAAGQGGQLRVFLFRDLQLVARAQFHDDVETVHGIQVQLVPQGGVGIEAGEIRLLVDIFYDFKDNVLDFVTTHTTGPQDS